MTTEPKKTAERDELLANVAEMYYQDGNTQAEISQAIGITRSAISRMLTEARKKGIVEIHIHRPLRFNTDLEAQLTNKFNLLSAYVVTWNNNDRYRELRTRLGRAAAKVVKNNIKPNNTIGVAWGTTVQSTIEAIEDGEVKNLRVVQLLGVLGSTRHAYSGQALVERLARKLGGEGIYLYTPFLVEHEDTAKFLRNDQSVQDAISLGKKADIALLGVGSTIPEFCSLFQGGHITQNDLNTIRKAGAVGDVSGQYFNIDGELAEVDFHKRVMGIKFEDLLNIPIRIGVAGSTEKAKAILGAIRGGFINILITDNNTATRMLEIADNTSA
jgi:DNA-binding transcriptional regulator LsrR (DeoR family)